MTLLLVGKWRLGDKLSKVTQLVSSRALPLLKGSPISSPGSSFLLLLLGDSSKGKGGKKKGSSFQTVSALHRVRRAQRYQQTCGGQTQPRAFCLHHP